jgi:uncharacterized protein YyaL (SSP411 family)
MSWQPFGSAAFTTAREEGKPVLLLLASLEIPAHEGFVCVRATAEARPDVHRRFSGYAAFVLAWDGRVMQSLPAVTAQALAAAAKAYKAPEPAPKGDKPVWTGAVGEGEPGSVDPDAPRKALAAVLRDPAPLKAEAFELLLYAASEWKEAEALARLKLEAESADVPARLLWDAWRLLRLPALKVRAQAALDPEPAPYADALAQRALACLSAGRPGEAEVALTRLRTRLHDPASGLQKHDEEGEPLLEDSAWTCLAFTEAFLASGRKADREFADLLMHNMFQELWDKDEGAFFDRRPDPILAPLKPTEVNSVALEALWRLRHLKGNMNYQRWLEWALKSLGPQPALARVQDMAARGRLELELVGRPGEPKTDALIAELNSRYLPRRITSFVDPDDQDYIMAHKLEAPSYPRLFGCLNFRPKASAGEPDQVAAVLAALSAS